MAEPNFNDEKFHSTSENLFESLEFYKDIIDHSILGFMVINQKKEIQNYNSAAASLFGYEKDEFLNLSLFDLLSQIKVDTEDEDIFVKKFLNNENIENQEAQIRKKNGDLVWIYFYTKSILNNRNEVIGNYFIGIDITKQKKIEVSLTQSEENYRGIFDSMKSAVVIYEGINEGQDFIFKEFNKSAEKIEKVNKEELIGKNVKEIFPGVEDFGLLNVFRRVWYTGIPEKHPLSYYEDDRIVGWRENYVYKLSSGEIVAIYNDLTEKVKHDQILRESENNLNQVLNFEKMITSISSRFVGQIDFDKAIGDTLKNIGISKMVSRVYLFSFDDSQEYMTSTHEWCDEGIEPHKEFYKNTPIKEFPVAMENIFQGKYISIEDSSDLTNGALKLKKKLSEKYVKATLAYPIHIHNKTSGFIGFDDEKSSRFWNPEDYSLLKITSQIIGNVLERKLAENNLKESEEKYRLISEDSDDLILVYNENLTIDYLNEKTHSRVLGYPSHLYWKQAFRNSLVHKDDLEITAATVKEGYNQGSYKLQLRYRHFKGHYLWFERTGKTFYDKNGAKKMLVVGRDITDIKLAEQKTKESEEKNRSLIEGLTRTGMGLDIVSIDHKILYQNKVLKEKFGDIVGMDCYYNYIGIDKPCSFCPMEKAIDTRKTQRAEVVGNDKRTYELISAPLPNADGTVDKAIEVIVDITEKKIAEQKLRESEFKLKERVKELNLLFEISKTIEKKNLSMEEFFQEILKNIPPAWRYPNLICAKIAYRNKEYKSINFQKTSWKISTRIKIGNDQLKITVFYLENKAFLKDEKQIIEEVAVRLKAILEQKNFEKKLKLSEEKYRTILESIKEGYYEVDLKGNFTFINDAICEITGYSKDEIVNSNFEMLCDENTRKYLLKEYNDLYVQGKGFKILEYQQIHNNKNKYYLESSIYLKFDSNDNIIGFKGVVRDVSERKKSEALRKEFNQKLEEEVELRTLELAEALEKQRLYLDQIIKASQFKTEFLATMSHELRTPLNAIIGFTDLLLEGSYGNINAEQLEFVKDIKSSAEHQFDMIKHILDISKIESGQTSLKIETFHLFNLMDSLISTLKPVFNEKNLKFEMIGFNKKLKIRADRLKIKQIFYNLISNAIKFTEKGNIAVEFREAKKKWEFKVSDTGIGIAKVDFDIIFKDFKRVKSNYVDSTTGSGLGLALTKRIVELHGGTIDFNSILGKGSSFNFTIPKDPLDISQFDEIENFLKRL